MGNLYSRTPTPTPNDTFNIHDEREAMDIILEISEQKMNEGDYLKISKCLKVIHEVKTHNIVPSHEILDSSMIEPNSIYILTHDETIQIMRGRSKYYFEFGITKLERKIAEGQLVLRQVTNDKKTAWNQLKKERTDETRKYHKSIVQKEKLIKAKTSELIKEIQKMEEMLKDFEEGNYNRVHL
jgi:hypothetical protein